MSLNEFKRIALGIYHQLIAEDPSIRKRSRIENWSIHGFWLSFLILPFAIALGEGSRFWTIVGVGAVCSLLACGFTFICCLLSHDLMNWKSKNYQFSLRTVFVLTSVVAVALAGI